MVIEVIILSHEEAEGNVVYKGWHASEVKRHQRDDGNYK